jgi:hypothetical protein
MEVEVIEIGLLPPSPEPKSMPIKKPTRSKQKANNDTFQKIPSNLDITGCSTQFCTLSHLCSNSICVQSVATEVYIIVSLYFKKLKLAMC